MEDITVKEEVVFQVVGAPLIPQKDSNIRAASLNCVQFFQSVQTTGQCVEVFKAT